MIGVQETTYTVTYNPALEECVCALRIGWRSKSDQTTLVANDVLRRRSDAPPSKQRLDQLWYRAMQRAGVV